MLCCVQTDGSRKFCALLLLRCHQRTFDGFKQWKWKAVHRARKAEITSEVQPKCCFTEQLIFFFFLSSSYSVEPKRGREQNANSLDLNANVKGGKCKNLSKKVIKCCILVIMFGSTYPTSRVRPRGLVLMLLPPSGSDRLINGKTRLFRKLIVS